MGFHGVQLLSLAFVGYGISVAAVGDYSGRYAALWGFLLALIGLFVDPLVDEWMERRRRANPKSA